MLIDPLTTACLYQPAEPQFASTSVNVKREKRSLARQLKSLIRAKDFEQLRNLLENSQENVKQQAKSQILWETSASRWTALHVAARSMMQEQFNRDCNTASDNSPCKSTYVGILQVPNMKPACGCCVHCDPWKWILSVASESLEPNWLARDKGGDTCVDIFFSSWMARNGNDLAKSFQKSLGKILDDKDLQKELRMWLVEQERRNTSMAMPIQLPSNSHVENVARVWTAMELLAKAMAPNKNNNSFAVVPFLAGLGSCPDEIALLAVTIFPEQAWTPSPSLQTQLRTDTETETYATTTRPPDTYTRGVTLPLHLWAQSPNPPDPDNTGILPLLKAYPNAVKCTDETGRLPLHWALAEGNKPFDKIYYLWKDNCLVLGEIDPVTRLPCFAMAAIAADRADREQSNGKQRRGMAVSLHDWLQTSITNNPFVKDEEGDDHSCLILTVLYEMLRDYPVALQNVVPPSKSKK